MNPTTTFYRELQSIFPGLPDPNYVSSFEVYGSVVAPLTVRVTLVPSLDEEDYAFTQRTYQVVEIGSDNADA